MFTFLDPVRGISLLAVIVKLLTAFALGCIIGIERSYKNRPAGFRTHILVTVGATVASMAGLFMYINPIEGLRLRADVSRIGAAVVSGLGFLGAGTIIVTKSYSVKGLTTAAGLWTSGIIGLAVGAGFYEGAVITAVLVLLAETLLGGLVSLIKRDPEFRISVLFSHKPALDQVLRVCKNNRMAITNLQVVSALYDEDPCYRAFISLRPRAKVDREKLFGQVASVPEILEFSEVDMSDER